MISPERWARLKPILEPALDLSDEEVPGYLDDACSGDAELRSDAELVLRAASEADSSLDFLDSPAAELAAPLLALEKPALSAKGLEQGSVVGTYTIDRRLGSGGMGVVYLARDNRLDRKVALKLLPPWLAAGKAANRRFMQEAKAASRLDHPNIQTVHEIGQTPDGRLFIAMAYYDGGTLQDLIAKGPVDGDSAIDIARQIATGLAAAHSRNIVHRDIKPGNVILTRDGVVKIVDFGAAKIADHAVTVSDAAHGTVAYMSPEQTLGTTVDRRTDLWSLGVVLYEMLTTVRPFRGDGADAVIFAIRHDEPTPLEELRPHTPEALVRIVRRCLKKKPEDRYQSAEELLQDLNDPSQRARRRTLKRRAVLAATAVALIAAAALVTRDTGQRGAVVGPATTIAVMPAIPVSADSALSRLGRELTVMLSANLDGMGGIRTIPALTVLAQARNRQPSLDESARLARQLGATSFLNGTVVRDGSRVRLDLTLFGSSNLAPIATASASAPVGDISALTDSATILLLREVWSRGPAPVPSIEAITTRSLPALRAYLEGELAFARGEFPVAVPAFERAFAADSTFALAYWRSVYPRIYEGSRPDSTIMAGILAHRDRIPYPDRLLVDAHFARTVGERLAALRAVTSRYSQYWPGWYSYADALFHQGPYLGSTQADALVAMKRVVELNPDFAVARQHLLWIAVLQRDTAAGDLGLAGLERFASPDAFIYNPANMTYFRALHALIRSNGEFSGDEGSRLAGVARSGAPRVPRPEQTALNLLMYGFPRAQMQQITATLGAPATPEMLAAQLMGKSYVWAVRGAWDSALVAAYQWVRISNDPQAALRSYGLAVTGTTTGGIEPAATLRLRPDPVQYSTSGAVEWIAELTWLDGIRAYAEGDLASIARSQRELAGNASRHGKLLAASLHAFHRAASGDRAEAARQLAAIEWDIGEKELYFPTSRFHPWLSAVHRPAAARWLAESGDTIEAVRLLSWHEAVLADGRDGTASRVNAANATVAPVALYERARLEEQLGRLDDARQHYRYFLERYDMPPRQHAAMVNHARAAVQRLDLHRR